MLEGAHVPEYLPQSAADVKAVRPHPVCPVGVGAHGDDSSAQVMEPLHDVQGGKIAAAAVQAAGIYLQALVLADKGLKNFIDERPVGIVGNEGMGGVGPVKISSSLNRSVW